MLKIENLRKLTEVELLKQISELKGKLMSLRFESSTGSLKENHLIKETKKDIAKIFTILKEKQVVAWKSKQVEETKKEVDVKSKNSPIKKLKNIPLKKRPLKKLKKEVK